MTPLKTKYLQINITASSTKTEIWLGDSLGPFKCSVGKLLTGLVPGNYTVEFGFGNAKFPIGLDRDLILTQKAIEATDPVVVAVIPVSDPIEAAAEVFAA
jgi:hypothetical protein